MMTKAQDKRCARQTTQERPQRLTALEKGLLRWIMAERGDKVLDAHVSNGLMLAYLQRNMECEVCGVSDDMQCVRDTRANLGNADIAYAPREDIPWRENTFDSVCLQFLVGTLSDTALREMLRVLKPGGQLLIGFRTMPSPLRPLANLLRSDTEDEPAKPRTRARILEMMREAGLTQITWQPIDLIHSIGIAWKPMEAETLSE